MAIAVLGGEVLPESLVDLPRPIACVCVSSHAHLLTTHPPSHLKRLAGDYGFDPLGLGKDPQALKWYQQAELVHGRTAMTAVAGILIPAVSREGGRGRESCCWARAAARTAARL